MRKLSDNHRIESGIDGVTVYIRLLRHRRQANEHRKDAKECTFHMPHFHLELNGIVS
jgi:hypothetical protein